MTPPGIVISALRGGSGKTITSLGIIASLRRRNQSVAPFKKGPDYIDAGWLGLAAGRACYNLDTFLIEAETIRRTYLQHLLPEDMAVIEGNRGLYDAIDTDGRTSTAELAKWLKLPVLLCIDCTKTTRTMAAVVSGCHLFDPDVNIRGVVLNRVAGTRHENILRQSIEMHCGIPVVGAIPKLREQRFPERHMGLVPTAEHAWAQAAIDAAAAVADDYLDLDTIRAIAADHSGPLTAPEAKAIAPPVAPSEVTPDRPRIGVVRDSAFQFYYPENLEALTAAGATVVVTSPLAESVPPALDGLYIGGGFPETHARQLADNNAYRDRILALAEAGMPIYAECGGLMYLGEALVLDGVRYPMCGVLPIVFGFSKRPQGHGYTILSVEGDNPYYPQGDDIRGHEFHYSTVMEWNGRDDQLVFRMQRGNGIIGGRDGVVVKNVLATYTHIHALGQSEWATTLVRNAAAYHRDQTITN